MEDADTKFIAQLAASIAPELCLTHPDQAIAAARKLLAAAQHNDLEDEEGEILREAKRADDFGVKTSGNLSIGEAFSLQQQGRFWKGKRSAGPYKNENAFSKALREKNLIWQDVNGAEGTTEKAIETLFMGIRSDRQRSDVSRKNASKKKIVRKI